MNTKELRFEVKIPVPLSQLEEMLIWLRTHPLMFRNRYKDRYVNSLYLDNPSMSIYEENLSGVSRRKKVRIRWYKALDNTRKACLEFKHRLSGKGYKKTFPIEFDISNSIVNWREHIQSSYTQLSDHDKPNWGNELTPILICRYYRQYFESACGLVRATIDSKIQVYDQRNHDKPNIEKGVPLGEYVLLELKANHGYEKELSALIATCPMRPSRHSKYVLGVRTLFWC